MVTSPKCFAYLDDRSKLSSSEECRYARRDTVVRDGTTSIQPSFRLA